jgi:hypothetical protein
MPDRRYPIQRGDRLLVHGEMGNPLPWCNISAPRLRCGCPGKSGNISHFGELPSTDVSVLGALRMVDTVILRRPVETAWSVFCATRDGVDVTDNRRSLFERHLQGRCEGRKEDGDELASFGLAYLARLPEDEC